MNLFDGTNVDEKAANQFDALPDGEYLVLVKNMELKTSENVMGCKMFKIEFEVVSGDKAGRKIFTQFIVEHPKEQARNIGKAKMKLLALAVTGTPILQSVDQAKSKPVVVKIKTTKNKETGQDNTNIQDIRAANPNSGAFQQATKAATTAPTAATGSGGGSNPDIPFMRKED